MTDPPADFVDPLGESPATLRMRKGPGSRDVISETLEPASILKNVFLGDFELLAEIARGGMGIVYKAKQWKLNRIVALKVSLAENRSATESLRLHAEAAAAAKLDHPNIVPVYEVGEADGRRFFSMAFIEGKSLAETLAAGPLPPRRAAELMRQVALAVAYAHSQGVIHRDLKPSNILLDSGGQARVTDFGLAKCTGADSSSLTKVGELMGTPSFMSPEQAESDRHVVGPATDVYSLGATLYCLVTGRPPFQAATPLETVKQVVEREPISPRTLNPAVDLDLDTICLKCLEKRPERRYGSATALAEDLQRFLDGRPIQARPVGRVEKLARWCRRNPMVAASLFAVWAIFLAAFALVTWSYWQVQEALAEAQRQSKEASLRREGELWELYKANVYAAAGALQLHNVGTARRRLDEAPEKHRNWEWKHFRTQLDVSQHILGGPALADYAAITPHGKRVFLHGPGFTFNVWDTEARKQVASFEADWREKAFSHDGRLFAYSTDEKIIFVRDIDTGQVRFTLRGHQGHVGSLFFSRDMRFLISGSEDRSARVWDLRTGEQVQVFRGHQSDLSILDVSADGRMVVSQEKKDLTCRVWDPTTGSQIAVLPGHKNELWRCLFSASGDRVCTVERFNTNTLRLFDPKTGELLGEMHGHTNTPNAAVWSPDGKTIATGSMDETVRVWDAARKSAGKRALAILEGHKGMVHDVRYSPDGKYLLSASQDQTLRLWDAATFAPLAVLHGHTGDVYRATFLADGKTIVSVSRDGTIRLWDAHLAVSTGVFRGHTEFVYGVVFHPGGEMVASCAWDGTVRLWNANTGKQLAVMHHEKAAKVLSVAFHPTGKLLASLGRDDAVRIWNSATGQQVQCLPIRSIGWPDPRLAFHPAGDLLAAGNNRGEIYLWRSNRTDAPEADWQKPAGPIVLPKRSKAIRDVSFSPDGRLLAAAVDDGKVFVWDVAACRDQAVEPFVALSGHEDGAYALAWSPGGKWLASGAMDGTVYLWDTTGWVKATAPLKHGASVYGLAFAPDGTRLAVACADQTIRLWDLAKFEEVTELRGHSKYVHALAFSPDGSRLVSASGDHTVRMWDTLSVQQRMSR